MMIESWNPPLLHDYSKLSRQSSRDDGETNHSAKLVMEEYELPLIDLSGLKSKDERQKISCENAIAKASSEWGFFQVVNHGVSLDLLRKMRREQMKLFKASFQMKATCGILNNSYRWGNSTATCPKQFSWSEAFHIPMTKISEADSYGEFTTLREVMVEYAAAMQDLAKSLAGVLVRNLGQRDNLIKGICNESSCFLRLNHYPPCQISPEIFGLVPHTDSDFLTILHQDEVGGLQLMKDSKWIAVKPNQNALIVNIGDLFQAWSNDVYKSVEHKVMANGKMERFSIAYFLCPSYDYLIGSCKEPSIYRKFTFGEYRYQIQQDVKLIGHKVGLSRFVL
ncbi:gibberellin 2-beta-dioxygenase 6-like [Nicotiana tabacum]|uniref:gibberellin 2beta-dioxygenase n=1 Tax=Nicotiana tabacum TaxID=4097 RepID=A0A1S3XD82_TOBAC|nr:PREDICTED: gibberellin 2-beta-dioxygenase 8-like [Nicotiana tabacum]